MERVRGVGGGVDINYLFSTHATIFFSQTLELLNLAGEILEAKDFDRLRKLLYGTLRTRPSFVKQFRMLYEKIKYVCKFHQLQELFFLLFKLLVATPPCRSSQEDKVIHYTQC